LQLQWIRCFGDVWCQLNAVNLTHPHFKDLFGVYVIWHGGPHAKTVRVGQGAIAQRLSAHRTEVDVQQYAHYGLFATWASVPRSLVDGVESYLFDHLHPLVGERAPDAGHISVNLPW
jgi:hypothetical protein